MSELWSRRGAANVGSLPSPTDESRPEPTSPGAANMLKSPDRRSPSCNRGKTMRDFEEELSNLKRENFDLKMRIYVLNEHLELVQSFDNIEEIYETHIKLKEEIKNLRVELEDKEDLILKTGDAMSLLNNKHREEIALLKAKAVEEAQKYEEFIQRLKQEMASNHRNVMEDSTAVYAMAFGFQDQLEMEATGSDFELKNQMTRLENELGKKSQELECADGEIRSLKQRIDELERETKSAEKELKTKTTKLEAVFTDLREREVKIDELHKQIFNLESLVKKKNVELETLSSKLESIGNKHTCSKDMKFLKEENELLREQQCSSCLKKSHLETELSKIKKNLEEKEAELQEKQEENVKTIKALQGFVKANKALSKDNENLKVQLDYKSKELETLKFQMESDKTLENIENETETQRDTRPEEKKMSEEKVKRLENEIKDLMKALDVKDKALKDLTDKARDEDKEEVEELKVVVSTLKAQLDSILTKENDEMKALKTEVETKSKMIDQLNEELRKRTFNLQELVNTELWDKNREIEKLNKLCEKKQQESSELRAKMESQQNELMSLNDKIEELSDNISSRMTKNDFSRLQEQWENEKENNKKLKTRCDELEKEVKKSEKARKELINACVLLQTRLEELVSFMDSLMPYAGKNKKVYQEAVDKSREVSRALSMSVLEETLQPILPDFSQVDFFHDSFREKSNEFVLDDVTEGSVPDLPSDITELKKIPPKMDSESEEWSEPDRNVSKERIGITETPVKIKLESSDVSEHSDKNPSKRRHKNNEVRKLNLKLKQLGDVVETLRLSPSKCQPDFSLLNEQNSTAVIIDKVMEGRKQIDETLKQSEEIMKQISCLPINEAEKTALENQITFITDRLAGMTILCQEFECFLIQTESERKSLCIKIFEGDRKVESLNTLILRQQSEIKEKENEVLEKQCAFLDLQNKFLINESKSKNFENRLAEANGKLQEYLKNSELEKQICYEKHAQEIAKIQHKLKQKQDEFCKETNQLKVLLEKANESIEELNLARINSEDEHKQQLDLIIKETKAKVDEETSKRIEAERKLVASYEIQADLRNQLENEITNTRTISSTQRKMESWWRKKLHESEAVYLERESDLRRRLDAATLSTSQAVLERTRLANDKIKLQCELRRRDDYAHEVKAALEQRVSELEEANNELEKKLACLGMPRSEPGSPNHNYNRQRSNPTSDYTSDPDHGSTNNIWFPCGRNNNCSPDLGIESDQGRLSSLDAVPSPKENVEDLKTEIEGLREELTRTKKAFTKTLSLLEDSKQKKKQIEKAISQQIGMTNKILSKARLNLGAPES